MRLPVLIFDIETLTDLKSGAHLYGLDLPEADLEQALIKLRRQESGMDFQRLALHEIVCISGLWLDEQGGMKMFSFSREQHSEAEILTKFLSIFDKRHPTLVSWNGSQFDLPVILFRAMYHGLSAPSLFDHNQSYHIESILVLYFHGNHQNNRMAFQFLACVAKIQIGRAHV